MVNFLYICTLFDGSFTNFYTMHSALDKLFPLPKKVKLILNFIARLLEIES